MSLETTISGWWAGAGGVVGAFIIVSTSYHNYKMREYMRRQAVALERWVSRRKAR